MQVVQFLGFAGCADVGQAAESERLVAIVEKLARFLIVSLGIFSEHVGGIDRERAVDKDRDRRDAVRIHQLMEHEHELLRIAQEALSNAVRHAHPSNVRITMTDEPAHWALAVADDGVGMEQSVETYSGEGFGLTSMRQRAGAIGGEWLIESKPGQGTRVSVRLPKRRN